MQDEEGAMKKSLSNKREEEMLLNGMTAPNKQASKQ